MVSQQLSCMSLARTFQGHEWFFCASLKLAHGAVQHCPAPLLVPGLGVGTGIAVPFPCFFPSFPATFSCPARVCTDIPKTRFLVSSGDFTRPGTAGAGPALQTRKLLAGRCSKDRDTRENKDQKESISLWKALWPCISSFGSHSSSRFAVSLLSIQSGSNFICAHFTQSLLISLKGDCLIFSFCMLSLLRSSLSYVKKAIRVVSVYFKQNGC